MCTVRPISKTNCPKGRAGISRMWVIPCQAVTDITFNADREVTAITVNCLVADWTLIEFDKDTAFFQQEKTKVSEGNTVVVQTLSFNEAIMNNTVRLALEDINDCCCLHAIVKDNTGRYHYTGITYFHETDTWQSEDMKTGDGTGNTGADSTADSNEYNETLVANVGYYAPFADDPANISNDCENVDCDEDAMLALNLDCWVAVNGDDLVSL